MDVLVYNLNNGLCKSYTYVVKLMNCIWTNELSIYGVEKSYLRSYGVMFYKYEYYFMPGLHIIKTTIHAVCNVCI